MTQWNDIPKDIRPVILFDIINAPSIAVIYRGIARYQLISKEWQQLLRSRELWTKLYQSLRLMMPRAWQYKNYQMMKKYLFDTMIATEVNSIYWKNYRILRSQNKVHMVLDNESKVVATLVYDAISTDGRCLGLICGDQLSILKDIDRRYEFTIENLSNAQSQVSFISDDEAMIFSIYKNSYSVYKADIKNNKLMPFDIDLPSDALSDVLTDYFGIYCDDSQMIYPWKSHRHPYLDSIRIPRDRYITGFDLTIPVVLVEKGFTVTAYDMSRIQKLWKIEDTIAIYINAIGAFIIQSWNRLIDPVTAEVIYYKKYGDDRYIGGVTLRDDHSGYIVWEVSID